MGRAPCCDKTKVKKGPWSPQEDTILKNYVQKYGTSGSWIALPHKAGLNRCGKSCRLRWLNYLRPDIKHGGFTQEEDNIILKLYHSIGSRWAVIAAQLPGRTDNDLKNYWNTKLKKKLFANEKSTSSFSSTAMDTASNAATTNNFSLEPISFDAEQINYTTMMPLPYHYPMEMNSHQQMANIPLPRLMEIPEIINGENNCVFPKCEETVPSLSPSFSIDNSTASCASSWSNNGYSGHEDDLFLAEFGSYDLQNYDFNFQERFSSTDDPYPNFLTNIEYGHGFFGQNTLT